jgi:DNA-binding protein HU-beta
MTRQFIADVIQEAGELTGVSAKRITETLIAAIQDEILTTGQFLLPGFGKFTLRETPAHGGVNPKTGESIAVKAGATVRFKAAPVFREAALAATKKTKRKAKQGTPRRSKSG